MRMGFDDLPDLCLQLIGRELAAGLSTADARVMIEKLVAAAGQAQARCVQPLLHELRDRQLCLARCLNDVRCAPPPLRLYEIVDRLDRSKVWC